MKARLTIRNTLSTSVYGLQKTDQPNCSKSRALMPTPELQGATPLQSPAGGVVVEGGVDVEGGVVVGGVVVVSGGAPPMLLRMLSHLLSG